MTTPFWSSIQKMSLRLNFCVAFATSGSVAAVCAAAFGLALPAAVHAQSVDFKDSRHSSPFHSLPGGLNPSGSESRAFLFRPVSEAVINLIESIVTQIDPETSEGLQTVPKYNRRLHFGGWIDADGDCQDTRNEVLVRDALPKAKISYRTDRPCVVKKAHWNDPYSGRAFKQAASVQVDHVVPLINAYYSGAFQWTPSRRCHYGNYLSSPYHLRTVSGHENMSKGGKSPERYMPPNERFACRYLSDWMKVKVIWELRVEPEEASAILALAHLYGCQARDLHMRQEELDWERQQSHMPPEKCLRFEARLEAGSPFPDPNDEKAEDLEMDFIFDTESNVEARPDAT